MEILGAMFIEMNVAGELILLIGFVIIAVALVICKKIEKKEYKKYIWGTILAIMINSYANSMTGAFQMHYMLTFIPLICITIGMFIKLCDKIQVKYIWKEVAFFVIVVIVTEKSYMNYLSLMQQKSKNIPIDGYSKMITEYIEQVTEPDDLVQIIGGSAEAVSANYRTKRLSASKYSYLPLWITFKKERKVEMTNELVEELKIKKPKLIVLCDYSQNNDPVSDKDEFYDLIENKEEWNKFLEENYIEPLLLADYFILYNRK